MVREEGYFVIIYVGFCQFFYIVMDIEQVVVGVDNVFVIDEQMEVVWFIRSDVQWINWYDVVFFVVQFVDEFVGFSIGGWCWMLMIIYVVFMQWIKFIWLVIWQYQMVFIWQINWN